MEYDYIILGGGSAGCVLANRLSARAANQVLLIEAGIDTPPDGVPKDILETFPKSAFNPLYKWTKLLVHTQALRRTNHPRPMPYEQGRVMGGGSSINHQGANRGAPEDYDEWAERGADGWGWKDVLPYFRKLETDGDFDNELHGREGLLPVQRVPRAQWCGYSEAIAQAAEGAGLPFLPDQNGKFVSGYFAATQSNLPRHRVSAAMAYLDRNTRQRPNLRILAETQVQDILFEGRRAVGVRAQTKSGVETFRAREIVSSMGAVHSPAMLMRAGIGNAAALGELGIKIIADVPGVGENLRDHPGVALIAYVTQGARVAMDERPMQVSMRFSSGLDGGLPGDMYASAFSRAGWHGVGRRLGTFITWLNKPHSTGRVSLRTTNWHDEPQIELNFFEDERDLPRLKAGFRFIASISDAESVRRATRDSVPAILSPRLRAAMAVNLKNAVTMAGVGLALDVPFLRTHLINSVINQGMPLKALLADDAALEGFIRSAVIGIKHLSCTCRMGRADDPMAVTDTAGRVRGVEGLRVCDASIMPSLPRAETNFPTMMTAEKIADQILQA